MRAVIQRVAEASVTFEDGAVNRIGLGLLVLVGVAESDTGEDVEWLAGKVARMRIFPDDAGLMNRSVQEVPGGGEILAISQFTLYASTRKGNRPSFAGAARPDAAIPRYEQFVSALERELGRPVATGRFGAQMKVALVNDGPVTIVVDSRARE